MVMSRALRPGWSGLVTFSSQQDGSGAGAEGGFGVDEISELVEHILGQQFQERGGFAARNDEAVDHVEVLGAADK